MGLAGTVGETTLSVAQLAEHTHPYVDEHSGNGSGSPSGQSWGYVSENKKTGPTGKSQPHAHPFEGDTDQADSLPPFLSFEMVVRVA